MPVGLLAFREQVVDRRPRCPFTGGTSRPPGFPEPAALGMPRQLQESDHVRGVHHAGYGADVVVVGAGAVVEVCDGLEVVVDTGGGMVGSWRTVVVLDSGAVVVEGRTAVVLVVGGTVLWTGVGAGATGTNTGRGTGAGRTSRYRMSTATKATKSAMVDRRTRMVPIMRGGWAA